MTVMQVTMVAVGQVYFDMTVIAVVTIVLILAQVEIMGDSASFGVTHRVRQPPYEVHPDCARLQAVKGLTIWILQGVCLFPEFI